MTCCFEFEDALKKYPNLRIILVGDQIQIESLLKKYDEINHPRLSIHKTTEVVLMDESPQSALKNKKNSIKNKFINWLSALIFGVTIVWAANELIRFDKPIPTESQVAINNPEYESEKPLFMFFTGSDWCGWCIRLQRRLKFWGCSGVFYSYH